MYQNLMVDGIMDDVHEITYVFWSSLTGHYVTYMESVEIE